MMDYENIPLYWINRLGFQARKELSRLFRASGYDVSPEEWAILLVLWSKGPLSPGAISELTIKDRTTVTRLADAMVRKGLVVRREDPEDRRKLLVDVSEKGAVLERHLVPLAQKLVARVLAGIPDTDIEITLKTFRKMSANLRDGPEG
ncbi:MarR family winged helix-turn-helix transcriptional regulator [Labrenzia sp. PHM005]|uniref:MarR family winged helix-turn-helix transcriptional regulator n=1 Tax=Labrenzia sp. PHM005 TaxID=2590016 RepID=UPI00113FFF57|nr:MarR family transcriptional regulator [Labrenzia sp. PHM005]QDG79104.1 MarR family transcriptional regulator [Labrenzia sp. PHM005]